MLREPDVSRALSFFIRTILFVIISIWIEFFVRLAIHFLGQGSYSTLLGFLAMNSFHDLQPFSTRGLDVS